MPFYGRHRVFALFWTWSIGPFVVLSDIVSASGSKSLGGMQRCKLQLYPRGVPQVRSVVANTPSGRKSFVDRTDQGYMDVLRPNDWVFIFVDPMDGDPPEPLFMGFIDDVRSTMNAPPTGAAYWTIHVSCSGWEKAFQNTSCISDAWVSSAINIATMYDIAIRAMVDNQTIPKIGEAIASVVQTFLDAEGTEEFLQRQATEFRTRESMAQEDIDRLVASLTGANGTQYTDTTASAGQTPINAIMGQFELPQTRTPLWHLIKMKFENLPDRTFSTPQGMVNMLGLPLSRFIDEWANTPMNALIYDVRRITADGASHISEANGNLLRTVQGGYLESAFDDVVGAANAVSDAVGKLFQDIAPHMILMRRPLFPDELTALDGPELSLNDLAMLNVGISDSDHYNLSWIEPTSLDRSQFRAATGLTGFDADRPRALDMIRRHGMRIYQDQTACWPDNSSNNTPPTVPTASPELMREWNERLQRAGLDQVEVLTGDMQIHKFVRGMYLGGRMIVNIGSHEGVFASGTRRIFYVDGYDWSYTGQNGQFDTDIALSRGYEFESTRDLPRVF